MLQARSGLPWNVTTGSDNNGDQSINDRPDLAVAGGDPTDKATYSSAFSGRVGNLGAEREIGRAFVQVDLRLSKFVRVQRYSFEGFIEAFNLLNRANLGVPNGTLTSCVVRPSNRTGLRRDAAAGRARVSFQLLIVRA